MKPGDLVRLNKTLVTDGSCIPYSDEVLIDPHPEDMCEIYSDTLFHEDEVGKIIEIRDVVIRNTPLTFVKIEVPDGIGWIHIEWLKVVK